MSDSWGTTGEPRRGVVIVGSITADVTTFSDRLPQPGETIHGDEFTLVLGGKGANQAIAAALAGTRTSIVGCVGDDVFREMIVDGFGAAGVDLTHLRTVTDRTGIAHIRVDATAQNNIVMVPLANAHLGADQIDAALTSLAPTTAVLLTQLEIPVATAVHAVRVARAAGITTVLDPAPAQVLPDDVYPLIDIVTPNETEAEVMSGVPVTDLAGAAAAGRWFLQRGVRAAIVTCADAGSVLVDKSGARVITPLPVTAIDTTAAGDAFAGYLGAGLAAGQSLVDAIVVANAAGALTVTVRGASPALPRRADVDAFLAAHRAAATVTLLEGSAP